MKRTIIYLLVLLLPGGCSLLEDDEAPKLQSAEFYESGDSQYPVIAIDETQTIFGFSENLDQLYVKLPEGDEWIMEFNYSGYPESMYIQNADFNLLLLFSEFDGDKCGVALINQNANTTEYFYDVEFSGISEKSAYIASAQECLKSVSEADIEIDIIGWWETYGEGVKKTIGPTIGAVGCWLSASAALTSGGILTPIAVLNCGSFASSIAGDIVGEESTAGGALFKGGAMVGKYGEMVLKCASQNWGSCTIAIGGEISAIYNLLNYGMSKSEAAEAKNMLETLVKTGGLAGNWKSEEIEAAGQTISTEYYFGLNAGRYLQHISQTAATTGVDANTTINLTFNYTVSANKLTTTITRVEINIDATQGGQTVSQTVGPFTWDEFVNNYGGSLQGGHFEGEITTLEYEIQEEGQKLILSDGQEFTRTN